MSDTLTAELGTQELNTPDPTDLVGVRLDVERALRELEHQGHGATVAVLRARYGLGAPEATVGEIARALRVGIDLVQRMVAEGHALVVQALGYDSGRAA